MLAWLALTVAGGLTVGTMQGRLALTVPLPDEPGFVASARIAALYHTGGPDAPAVIVVRLPPGVTAGSPGVRAELGQLFGRVSSAGYRVVSYASTGDAAFTAAGGRVAYALVFTPPVTSSAAPPAAGRISALLAGAVPRGWQAA